MNGAWGLLALRFFGIADDIRSRGIVPEQDPGIESGPCEDISMDSGEEGSRVRRPIE